MSASAIRWSESNDIVTLTLDDPTQSVNTVNAAYLDSMASSLARLAELPSLRGVIVTSAKKTFFAGGDLQDFVSATSMDAGRLTESANLVKSQLRRLERLPVPVVAAMNGSALGGGLELALACHRRILLDSPRVRVGLPEVTLGLLPGGGGIVRSVHLLGLDAALDSLLLSGKSYDPNGALKLGIVDELAADADQLIAQAIAWIEANPGAAQPWDRGAPIPGGDAKALEPSFPGRTAALRSRFHGAPMQASENILSAAVETMQVDFDTALKVETRYFVELATSQVSTNIIQGSFFDRQTIRSGASRPSSSEFPAQSMSTVAIVGAGMMGAGIALSCSLVGINVRLNDVDFERASRGLAYAQRHTSKAVARGDLTEAQAAEVLDRIVPTGDIADLAGVDLVIEAVFEDPELKAGVFRGLVDVVGPDALFASNTSTLPITDLARSVERAENFVGLHFFSPVERMELVEIIVGEQTSEATLAKAFDVVVQLGKTPIVVGDGRGFFTSRVILTRLLEAAAMLGEGIPAPTIEQASLQAGYPVGTLALLDELTLTLPHKIFGQFRAEAERTGAAFSEHPGDAVLAFMIDEAGRVGRAAGAGFYDYSDGRREDLWPGLAAKFGAKSPVQDLGEVIDRFLFGEAIETARCLESGLLRSKADANVGSMLGIGYPRWTGGAAQFIDGYPGGKEAFVSRANYLSERYGPRFKLS